MKPTLKPFPKKSAEPGEGTPAEEAKDAKENAQGKSKTVPAGANKVPAGSKAVQPKLAAAPRLADDPLDPDADGEARPSKGKPGASRQFASVFARSSRKSGAKMI